MTATETGPRVARDTWEGEPRPAPAPQPHGSVVARWALAWRMAWRQVRRSWPSSLLIVALVFLPLAGVSAGAVYSASLVPTPDEEATAELGRADAWATTVGGSDPSQRQYLDEPQWVETDIDPETGAPLHEPGPLPDDPGALLPADELLTLTTTTSIVETDEGLTAMTTTVGHAWDPRLEGRYELLEGREPADRSEIVASRSALARIGVDVGDSVTLTDPATTARVVGVLESRMEPDEVEHLFVPRDGAFAAPDDAEQQTRWFAFGWSPTPDEIFALNEDGIVVYARDLAQNPGEYASPQFDSTSGSAWAMFTVALAGLVFCVYIVLLLAGAAFSVSARRQQRALAIAASVGAARADVFRVVLLQGTLLGLAGGALGVAAGIGLGAAALAVFSDGSVHTGWALHVPWLILVGLVVFAAVVGTLAAAMPARAATRGDVLAALRGARRPVSVSAKRPVWGLVLMIAGLAIVAAGVVTLIAMYNAPGDRAALSRQLVYAAGAAAMILGPLLLQIGVIVAGHWLIARLSRLLSRVGLGARIASRDAVANPSRIVPSFGAIAACAFLAAGALGGATVLVDSMRATMTYAAAPGDAWTYIGTGDEDPDGFLAAAEGVFVDAGAESTGVLETRAYVEGDDVVEFQFERACADGACDPAAPSYEQAVVVAADDVAAVLGQEVDEAVLRAYAAGGAITTDADLLQGDDTVAVREWREDDLYDPDASGLPEAIDRHEITAAHIDIGRPADVPVFLSPTAAEAIGLDTSPDRIVAHFADGITPAQSDQMMADATTLTAMHAADDAPASIHPMVQDDPPTAGPWLALILGAVTVLVVGASAVALGLSRVERRSDDATLAAVGASPRVRRHIGFWQALVVAGFGCLTGTVAGVLPALGAIMILDQTSGTSSTYAGLPWPLYGVLAIALPLAVAVWSWMVPPRAPDLTRRTAIA